MTFQISSMPAEEFAALFHLSHAELAERNIQKSVVDAKPGTPCRVSMADAEVGDTVLLLNYQHQPAESPYKAAHAIYVRQDVAQNKLGVGEVPEVIRSRLMSLRLFDKNDMMVDADVVEGDHVAQAILKGFEDDVVAYAHLHYAKPGCFAGAVTRVT